MYRWLAAVMLGVASVPVPGAPLSNPAPAYAWMDGPSYRPPDFAGYFPDCPEGARELAAWWRPGETPTPGAEALALVRGGLRRYEGDPAPLLRWVGHTFLSGKDPQHPDAIELMYHAADCDPATAGGTRTRGAAVYFGLAVVRPKTDAILRTLVDLCMRADDPNELSRVAWGLGEQRDAALRFLAPYRDSDDGAVREKAAVVRKILLRELGAFAWAGERNRAAAAAAYGHRLDEFAAVLRAGTSAARGDVLDIIEGGHVMSIMGDDRVADFARCARDPDPVIRARVARLAGERWIGASDVQNAAVVTLMLALSEDSDRYVRYNAVYFGLSPIMTKDTDVLKRLLEIAFDDREPNMYQRIVWSMRGHRSQARALLDAYIAHGRHASAARDIYNDMVDGPAPRAR